MMLNRSIFLLLAVNLLSCRLSETERQFQKDIQIVERVCYDGLRGQDLIGIGFGKAIVSLEKMTSIRSTLRLNLVMIYEDCSGDIERWKNWLEAYRRGEEKVFLKNLDKKYLTGQGASIKDTLIQPIEYYD